MIEEAYARTLALIGHDAFDRIRRIKVAVVGLGGVGGSAAMTLARSGVGHLLLIDGDHVAPSNLNRQAVARMDNLGACKADAMAKELHFIAPALHLEAVGRFLHEENASALIPDDVDYVIDAIDRMRDKIALIRYCHQKGIPTISATGAGNRLRADQLCYADVFRTSGDPVCRILRRELRGQMQHHPVVYSKEPPMRTGGERVASMSFVPNAMGILLSQAVVLSAAEITPWEEWF